MSGLNKDELTKLIYDNELFHGTVGIGVVMDINHLTKFAELVAAEERDECACLCDALERTKVYGAKECAQAIRLRGQE